MKIYAMIWLLLLPGTAATILNNEAITETIIVNDSLDLTIRNSLIISDDFMQINCQEDIQVGLVNCSDINISLNILNSRIYSDFIIYSDEVITSNIYINNNWHYDYNGYDSWYVWEHNHDIIDYNPKTKPLYKPRLQIKS